MGRKSTQYPPDSMYGLWYDPDINRFRDESGEVIHDLSPHFHTWQLDEWKKAKKFSILRDRTGELWEIFYGGFYCHHGCLSCGTRCEIYYLVKE